MTPGERVKQVRKSLSISQQRLAESIKVSRSYINDIEGGRAEPSFNFLRALSDVYNVSIDWVATGEGPMFRQQEAKPDQTPEPNVALDPKMTAVIKTVQMMPLEKQQEFIAETQKRAESIKQFLEMQERIERLEKEKCA